VVLGALVLLLTAACSSPQRLSGNVGPVGVTPASSSSHSVVPTPTISYKNFDYGAAQGNPSGVDITFKVPTDWERTIHDGGLRYDYTDPQTNLLLRLDFSEPSGIGAVANWESYSQDFAQQHPGYELLKPIGSVGCPSRANDCADWEFTFPEGGVIRQVIDRAILGDNVAFAVYISAPTNVFPQAKAVFDYVVQTLTIG
jgi:hypothetical protein